MRAKRIEGDKKGTGTRKEQMGEGNRKEPEARGLDQEDVRPGRSGEAEAKAGGPGPAHVRGHFPSAGTGRAAVRRGQPGNSSPPWPGQAMQGTPRWSWCCRALR